MFKFSSIFFSLFLTLFFVQPVLAQKGGVGLSQTRIVMEEGKSTAINIQNRSSKPYLVANYITKKYNENRPMEGLFLITPNLFKVQPNSYNAVKIQVISNNNFQKDRESLYYFHSRNIPESKNNEDGMNIGLENVIKLFYRPKGLSMSPSMAFSKPKFTFNGSQLVVENNTPYHINLASLTINKVAIKLNKENNILYPFSTSTFSTIKQKGMVNMVKWSVFNDLGGLDEFSQKIN